MPASYRFVVTGRVQGVGFRAAARRKALTLGLRGWVRNRSDGAVEGQVQGDDEQRINEFRVWLTKGPPMALVSRLEWSASASDDDPESGFLILR
jgi:acylphosphatase